MKANELRLGNWVQAEGLECRVLSLSANAYVTVELKDEERISAVQSMFKQDEIEPIPITEEILLSCGFKYNKRTGDYNYCRHDENIHVAMFSRPDGWGMSVQANDTNIQMKREYLHELQNIYFIATGEELEVEL